MNNDFNFDNSFYDEQIKKQQHRSCAGIVSRPFIALGVFFLVCYFVIFLIEFTLLAIYGNELPDFFYTPYFNIILNVVSMYVIGFPVFLLVAGKPKCSAFNPETEKFTPKTFILFLLMGEGAMFTGSIMGQYFSTVLGKILGGSLESSIENTIDSTPMWLLIIVAVIIGPIIEEIMFRKVLIDHLAPLGNLPAIIISSIAFGLFHTNFYQFFYAVLIGAIFAYIYLKTRNVKITILLHICANFLGSVIPTYAQKLLDIITPLEEAYASGAALLPSETVLLLLGGYILTIIALFQYALYFGGIGVIIYYFFKKKFYIQKNDLLAPPKIILRASFVNFGSIFYLVICAVLFVLGIITSLITG